MQLLSDPEKYSITSQPRRSFYVYYINIYY